MIRTAILASTPALRSGLRALLNTDEDIEVLAESASLAQLHELDGLDVLIMAADELPAQELRGVLADAEPPPALLLLSDDPTAGLMLMRLQVRAWGLLPPETSEEELIAAVHALHEGLMTASPALIQPLLGTAALSPEINELTEELTARELDVLQLLAQGFPNKQIALSLDISEHTVKFHSSSIYAKLGVTNRTEAVRRGVRLGLITL
ncbi:MAG: response regulator transcription factor [Anaerolineales bacterium]